MELFFLTLHIIGAGILTGLVVITFLIAFRTDFSLKSLAFLNKVKFLGPATSGFQFLTGAILYWGERDELLENNYFWLKMILYLIEGTLAGLVIDRKIKQVQADPEKEASATRTLRWLYGIHALLIISIVVLGAVIANAGHGE